MEGGGRLWFISLNKPNHKLSLGLRCHAYFTFPCSFRPLLAYFLPTCRAKAGLMIMVMGMENLYGNEVRDWAIFEKWSTKVKGDKNVQTIDPGPMYQTGILTLILESLEFLKESKLILPETPLKSVFLIISENFCTLRSLRISWI